MIYFSADFHGDIERFREKGMKKLGKRDTLVICGDFGFLWNESPAEKKLLDKISKSKYKILAVDGSNENFDILERYEITQTDIGKARKIGKNLYIAVRGEIYNIDGQSVFAFGGGLDDEYSNKEIGVGYFAQCNPSDEDYARAEESLSRVSSVDYIATHIAPAKIHKIMSGEREETLRITTFLEQVREKIKFTQWYFGRYHKDKLIPPQFTAVFKEVVAGK